MGYCFYRESQTVSNYESNWKKYSHMMLTFPLCLNTYLHQNLLMYKFQEKPNNVPHQRPLATSNPYRLLCRREPSAGQHSVYQQTYIPSSSTSQENIF